MSVAVLSIPYVGLENLRELERHLRDALEISLMDAARALAGPLHEREILFPVRTDAEDGALFVHTLKHPVQLDGYTDDWNSYLGWSDIYGINKSDDLQEFDPLSYRLIVSEYHQYFNILIQVKDVKVVYQKSDIPDAMDNDHVVLSFIDPQGSLNQYIFSPAAPGGIRPFKVVRQWDEFNPNLNGG